MQKIELKKIADKVSKTAEDVKKSIDEIDLTDVKSFGEHAVKQAKDFGEMAFNQAKEISKNTTEQLQGAFHKKESAPKTITINEIPGVTFWNSIKVYYYLMAADGEIGEKEEEKLTAIGRDLITEFDNHKDDLLKDCKDFLDKVVDSHQTDIAIEEAVKDCLLDYTNIKMPEVSPRQLLWNMFTIAYSDEEYDVSEKNLIKFVANEFDIDEAILAEIESSMITVLDIEKEITWLKTTNRPYAEIEAMINELRTRENVIAEGVYSLIAL